ncbi:unnamed protein product [Symbiodinium sp. CCMP2592]|nr:unnamed protein product [Symbiodinium sp. CCMP2592]
MRILQKMLMMTTAMTVSEKVATENRFEQSNQLRERMLANPSEKRWLYRRVLTTYHDTTLWHDFVEGLDVQKVGDFTTTFILRAHLITRFLYGEMTPKFLKLWDSSATCTRCWPSSWKEYLHLSQ